MPLLARVAASFFRSLLKFFFFFLSTSEILIKFALFINQYRNMDKTYRRENYPLLGEPKLMFEGDNIYVVHERAEIGKTYSFICPHCHTPFASCTYDEEVMKAKCPECNTYIYFSSRGSEGIPVRPRTKVIAEDSRQFASPGLLFWAEKGIKRTFPLVEGSFIIGRMDASEPSDIAINDEMASRRSVKLSVNKGEASGRYTFKLTVLRTTNAVYVNNNALYSKSSIYLNYGDTFKIGETVFTLTAQK